MRHDAGRVDDRHDYGETRLVALGLVGARVMLLVYTERDRAGGRQALRKAAGLK